MRSDSDQSLVDRTRAAISELGVKLSPDRFIELHSEGAHALENARFVELVFATACLDGDRSAVATFLRRFEPAIARVAEKSFPEATREDFVQSFISHLLVGDDIAPPGLRRFSGKGTLLGFIRMMASRRAIDRVRKAGTEQARARSLGAALLLAPSPEERSDQIEVKRQFTVTLGEVLRGLRPIDRRALRMRYLLGFSVAKTATALQMHDRSVSRLVSRLRAEIYNEMAARMQVSSGTKGELMLTSLDVSMSQWLRSNPDDGEV